MMIRMVMTLTLCWALPWQCGRRTEPAPETEPTVPKPERPPEPPSVPVPVGPLDRRGSFDFDGVVLPAVISRMAKETGLAIAVAPSIPVDEWSRRSVTLRMKDVTIRDFLDWLARIARAEYAVASDGTVWLTRGDSLLLTEPLEVRATRIPTHFAATRPVRGVLDYSKEQEFILTVLKDCLRYLLDRRQGCRLAFHGEQDVLATRLPGRGHKRVEAILHAVRHGTPRPQPPKPSASDIEAALEKPLACDWPPENVSLTLRRVAAMAEVNIGWDSGSLPPPLVVIPRGTHSLAGILKLIIRQTPFGRYKVEPGRGVWLYLEGRTVDFPLRRAVVWDRMVVRAYEIRNLIGARSPSEFLDDLKRRVDPGSWDRGFPAAGIFPPTRRLIIVHDEEGHPRVAAALRVMEGRGATPSKEGSPQ
jgi:hypothetical protein